MADQTIHQKLAKLSNGEFPDFNTFYAALASPLRAHLFRMCGAASCDDLVQEAFVKAWKALPNFRGDSSLKTWMYRIATHVAIDHIRKNAPLKGNVELNFELQSPTDDPEKQRSYEQLANKAIARLESTHRATFVMHVFDELSVQEIADVLAIPVGTVKSRLSKARAILSEYLKKEGISYE